LALCFNRGKKFVALSGVHIEPEVAKPEGVPVDSLEHPRKVEREGFQLESFLQNVFFDAKHSGHFLFC
jgi:hypothetical protein